MLFYTLKQKATHYFRIKKDTALLRKQLLMPMNRGYVLQSKSKNVKTFNGV